MAMIDYGAIAFKNGEQINHEFVSLLENKPPSEDKDAILKSKISNECSLLIGDRKFLFGCYKDIFMFGGLDEIEEKLSNHDECFTALRWQNKKSIHYQSEYINLHIKYISNSISLASIDYKDDHYKILFGYGIDYNMNSWDSWKKKYHTPRCWEKIEKIIKNIDRDYFN